MLRETVKTSILCFFMLGAAALVPYGQTILLTMLAFWSVKDTKAAIQSLTLSVIVRFLNPAIFFDTGPVVILGWVILGLASIRVLVSATDGDLKLPALKWLTLYVSITLVLTMLGSLSSTVSLFKLISFWVTAAIIMIAFNNSEKEWSPWFLGIWSSVFLLSVPTYFVPSIGYFRDQMGFQGILNHPQAYAVFAAPMIAWLMGAIIFSNRIPIVWGLPMAAVATITLVLTRGRTGVAALIIGLFGAFIILQWRSETKWANLRRVLRSPVLYLIGFSVIVLAISRPDTLTSALQSFLVKNVHNTDIVDSFQKSRGFLIDQSLKNFYENVWFGIGFGVSNSETHAFDPVIEPITGLPLSAPTEKPNIIIALLEETGIFGTFFFLIFASSLFRQVSKCNDFAVTWMVLTAVSTNVAETTFFSIGGLGLYVWLLIGWASTATLSTHFRQAGDSSELEQPLWGAGINRSQRLRALGR